MEGQRNLTCDECGGVDRFVLHNVRYLNNLRRFCTACVLKRFPGLFCPVCFRVFETIPPPSQRSMCLTCPSIAHLSCATFGERGKRYECRHCKNRNPNYFELKFDGKRGRKGDEIDSESAGRLYAAAWIASTSMRKAAVAAREEAEKKAREALVARRNVKEALERLSILSNRNAGEHDQNGAASEGNGARRHVADGEGGYARVTSAVVTGESSRNGNAGVVGESSRNGNAGSNLRKKRKH